MNIMAEYIDLISVVCSILVSVITIGISVYKVIKNGKKNDKTNKLLDLISAIPALVIKAEEIYGVGKGAAKLDYVLTKLKLQAVTMSVEVSDDFLTQEIENIVEATKTVNAKTNNTGTGVTLIKKV